MAVFSSFRVGFRCFLGLFFAVFRGFLGVVFRPPPSSEKPMGKGVGKRKRKEAESEAGSEIEGKMKNNQKKMPKSEDLTFVNIFLQFAFSLYACFLGK